MNTILARIQSLLKAIKPVISETTAAVSEAKTSQLLKLPHPEEKPDYTRNPGNVSFPDVLERWFETYDVPGEYRDFWLRKIVVNVTDRISVPAQTWEQDGVRHLDVRPEWLNPGVIAHEQAHNSFALLTGRQKKEFSAVYAPLKATDPLIRFLYSINTYGLTNDIEGHAEVYRYIGSKMPEILKKYYPRLFRVT